MDSALFFLLHLGSGHSCRDIAISLAAPESGYHWAVCRQLFHNRIAEELLVFKDVDPALGNGGG